MLPKCLSSIIPQSCRFNNPKDNFNSTSTSTTKMKMKFKIKGKSILKGKRRKIPKRMTIIDYMDKCIKKNNRFESPALIFQNRATHTFQSLENISNRVAHVLSLELVHVVSSNVNNDFIVGFCLRPTDKTIVLILAILKLGAAYMSLDLKWGPEKLIRQISYTRPLAVIIEDDMEVVGSYSSVTQATKVISLSYIYALANKFQRFPVDSVIKRSDLRPLPRQRSKESIVSQKSYTYSRNLRRRRAHSNSNNKAARARTVKLLLHTRIAAIVYTSGTCSHPKAVRVSHTAILNSITSFLSTFTFDLTNDVYCLTTPICFGSSIQQIFAPLTQGIPLVVLQRNQLMNIPELIRRVQHNKITRLFLQPAHLHLLLDYLLIRKNMDQKLKETEPDPNDSKEQTDPKFQIDSNESVILDLTGKKVVKAGGAGKKQKASPRSGPNTVSGAEPNKSGSKKKKPKFLSLRQKLASLKYINCSGYPLPSELAEKFFQVFDPSWSLATDNVTASPSASITTSAAKVPEPTVGKGVSAGITNKKILATSPSSLSLKAVTKTLSRRPTLAPRSQSKPERRVEYVGAKRSQGTQYPYGTASGIGSGERSISLSGPQQVRRSNTVIQGLQLNDTGGGWGDLRAGSDEDTENLHDRWKEKVVKNRKYKDLCTSLCWLISSYGTAEVVGDISYEIFYGWQDYLNKKDGILVTIGKPIHNANVYILDKNLHIVPLGERGEICISGRVVASGYSGVFQSPEFVDNRLSKDKHYNILFRTGDYGRISLDKHGSPRLFFSKRSRSEVICNGVVQDLNALSRFISSIAMVLDCVVACYHPDLPDQRIIAACILEQGISENDVRIALQKHLNNQLFVDVFKIKVLPFQTSGVIDNAKILSLYRAYRQKELPSSILRRVAGHIRPQVKGKALQEREKVAQELCTIIARVISVSPKMILERFSSSFYDIGGNSINTFAVVNAMELRGYFMTVYDFVKFASKSMRELLTNLLVIIDNNTRSSRLNRMASVFQGSSTTLEDGSYHFYPLEVSHVEAYHIVADAYVSKSILCLYTHVTEKEFGEYLRLMWENFLDSSASLAAKSSDDENLLAVLLCVSYANRLVPKRYSRPKISKSVRYIIELYQYCTHRAIHLMETNTHHILLAQLFATSSTLKPDENVLLADIMFSFAMKREELKQYDVVMVVSENPIIKQICGDQADYNLILEYPVHSFVASDYSRPFKFVPAYHNVFVYCRYFDE